MVRSIPLLQEMERVIQDGSEIAAEGRGHDDRVFASAFCVKAWIDWVRNGMISTNQTYAAVLEEEKRAREAPLSTMVGRAVADFFKECEIKRAEQEETLHWQGYT